MVADEFYLILINNISFISFGIALHAWEIGWPYFCDYRLVISILYKGTTVTVLPKTWAIASLRPF